MPTVRRKEMLGAPLSSLCAGAAQTRDHTLGAGDAVLSTQ